MSSVLYSKGINVVSKCLKKLTVIIKNKELSPDIRILSFAATAASLNNMDALYSAIDLACKQNIVTELELYETLLQIYLFAGFPASLEGLSILNKYMKINKDILIVEPYNLNEFTRRGESLCKAIYTNVYEKMRSNLSLISPELDRWMIIEGYGKTLSRSGLTTKTRELITVSCLAALGWENQLYSHIRGAINSGASSMETIGLLDGLEILCSKSRFNSSKLIFEKVIERMK